MQTQQLQQYILHLLQIEKNLTHLKILGINFQNIFPISLGALDFTQAVTDVEYMTVTAEFAYQIYEINTL